MALLLTNGLLTFLQEWKYLLYAVLQYVATVVYLFTAVCHILLVSKRTFHAWTIFCLILSLCFCSLFVGTRNLFDYIYDTRYIDVIPLRTPGSMLFGN